MNADTKKKIWENLALYELRTGRGSGIIAIVTSILSDMLKGGVYLFSLRGLAAVLLTYEISLFQYAAAAILWIPPWIIAPAPFLRKAVDYLIGWKDEGIGYSKFKNGYSSKYINEYNAELLDRVRKIEMYVRK